MRIRRPPELHRIMILTILAFASVTTTTIYHVEASFMIHNSISITGNDQFTLTNGVTQGNGSSSNPFIIENWEIDPTTTDGIHIEHTNVSFIIRNILIQGGTTNGIFLLNVDHAIINNTTIRQSYDGITISLSNATIEYSHIVSNNDDGIRMIDTENVSLFNNTIAQETVSGIYSENCVQCNLNVTRNLITTNFSGIDLQSMNNTLIFGNTISSNQNDGITAYKSTYTSIVLNNITINGHSYAAPGFGVNLVSSTNSLVHHNNFVDNRVQALDNETGQNMWDVGYASGGNYWSDYTWVDNCSGPQQDICTRPDGIGDTPHVFASAKDNYPLMKFFVQTIVHDVAVSSIIPSATSVNETASLSVNVTVTNEGAVKENFTLTLYYDQTTIGSQVIQALAPSTYQTIQFNWNTTGVSLGPHYLKAIESTVWGEIDVADNTLVVGPITVTTPSPTTPSSPPPTGPLPHSVPPQDFYLETGTVGLFLLILLVIVAYRRRGRTR